MGTLPTNQSPSQGPGINGTTPKPFGSVVIEASCAPQRVAGYMAFLLPCGGTLLARGKSPVIGQAQLVDSENQPQGPVKSFTLMPGQSQVLATPPKGEAWLVADMSQAQADWIAVGTLAGAVTVAGFATYGVVEAVEHLVARHRRKVAMRRLARLFWGN